MRAASPPAASSSATTRALAPQAVSKGVSEMIRPTVSPISARKPSNSASAPKATADLARSATKLARVFWKASSASR
ncbi:hypothetical protein D3C83_103420 [compost metagenome]